VVTSTGSKLLVPQEINDDSQITSTADKRSAKEGAQLNGGIRLDSGLMVAPIHEPVLHKLLHVLPPVLNRIIDRIRFHLVNVNLCQRNTHNHTSQYTQVTHENYATKNAQPTRLAVNACEHLLA
jgi:hypothetical protein